MRDQPRLQPLLRSAPLPRHRHFNVLVPELASYTRLHDKLHIRFSQTSTPHQPPFFISILQALPSYTDIFLFQTLLEINFLCLPQPIHKPLLSLLPPPLLFPPCLAILPIFLLTDMIRHSSTFDSSWCGYNEQ